jgi:crossover junction endodeoxyribonuclease RuvC
MGTDLFIGFDPGLTGAGAIVHGQSAVLFDLPTRAFGKGTGKVKAEVDPVGLLGVLVIQMTRFPARGARVRAIVERTASRPGQGVASMYSMGFSRGVILGVLAGHGITARDVEPAKWKAAFGLIGAPKEESLRVARELYPFCEHDLRLAKHHNRAEALLLAHYLKGIAA